ncbi:aldehyde dehydrogenase family protein [Cupriavidus sp. 2TAF22]|uniref:aldehyde dehydrogenase family protein n=1 Tax=unclassified Cupriavidus TaxID=2640874 RepID=UPI003F937A93
MQDNTPTCTSAGIDARIAAIVACQRAAHLAAGPASAAQRIDWLDRAIGLLVDHQQEIVETIGADFGHRSHDFSRVTEVLSPLNALKHARAQVEQWMQPEPRPVPRGEAWVQYQPRGVVGVMGPWNFPMAACFMALPGILAAGNRAVIKPSEFTPATAELMARLIRSAYDEREVAVVTGGQDVGEAFTRQRFDHLLFTGAGSVGRKVMAAAAQNLVPVTLELGGKSPTIVSQSADLREAAARIMAGKLCNAGQICLAPDYVFVPKASVEAFIDAARDTVARCYPTLRDNPDYTAIVNERHLRRLQGYLADAARHGARVVELSPANESFDDAGTVCRMAPALVIDPTDDMAIMQDEIFGPLLPVKPYDSIDEVLAYIEAHPHPLGLYYFGTDPTEEARVLDAHHVGRRDAQRRARSRRRRGFAVRRRRPKRHGRLPRPGRVPHVQPRASRLSLPAKGLGSVAPAVHRAGAAVHRVADPAVNAPPAA